MPTEDAQGEPTEDPQEDSQEPTEDSLNQQVNAWLQRQYQGVRYWCMHREEYLYM